MSGCDELVFDREHADENLSIANTYGSELAGNFGMIECGEPVVRGGKCEMHKVERRSEFGGDRRDHGSSDSPPSCGNTRCCVEEEKTRHDTLCDDYGPGWC